MATKAELEEEVESLKRTVSSLKGQATRLRNEAEDSEGAEEQVSDSFRGLVATLLQAIEDKGLVHQIGNKKQYSNVKDAM